MIAALAPTVTLASTTSIAFNQTAINNVLTFSHTINSLGAGLSGVSLEFRRNSSGAWTVLSTTGTASSGTFTHTMTDSAFNTLPFNYRFNVTDTVGATGQGIKDITITTRQNPTSTLTVTGTNVTSNESTFVREKGNVVSIISGVISRGSPNVPLTSWQWEFRENAAASWTTIGPLNTITGDPSPYATGATTHSTATTVNSAEYRIRVKDTYYDSNTSSLITSTSSTINYYNYIFYGPSGSAPTTSNDVRSLPVRTLSVNLGDPFNLNTGTEFNRFTVALPSPLTISSVFDLDGLNANITSLYIRNYGLTGIANYAAGLTSEYRVYTMSPDSRYTDNNHRHSVTRVAGA
jgi:hypothetical protein